MDSIITRRLTPPSLSGWVRNPNWLPLPTVLPTQQRFVGLHAVWPDSNFLAIGAAGAYTVDWGDGTTQNVANGAIAYKQYDFNNPALDGTNAGGALPYKQVIVTITPQAGRTLTSLNLNFRHTAMGSTIYCSGWLDMVISGPSLTRVTISSTTQNVRHDLLEQASLLSNNCDNFAGCFNNARSLQSLPVWYIRPSGAVNLSAFLAGTTSLRWGPELDTQAVTTTSQMFTGSGIRGTPLYNFQSVTTALAMFSSCLNLAALPTYSFSALIRPDNMLQGCVALVEVPPWDLSAVTVTSLMLQTCPSLTRFRATGLRVTISFSGCKLSAAALDEIYTNLVPASGQTITVTANWGAASDNPAIATAKGWTVVGS